MSDTNSETDHTLKPKMRRFIDTYIANGCNGAAAARVAGYSQPNKAAYRLLQRDDVRQAINEKLEHFDVNSNEILARITSIAQTSLSDFLEVHEDGTASFNLTEAAREGKLHHIKKLRYDSHGNMLVELYDPVEALELLAKLSGMLHRAGEEPEPQALMTLEEWEERRQRTRAQAAETLGWFNSHNGDEE